MPYGSDPTQPPSGSSYQFPGLVQPPPQASPILAPPTGQAAGPVDRQTIVGYWKGKGVPDYVAEGIADATHDESGIKGNPDLFNPVAVNPASGAVGLQQDLGSRKKALQANPNWQDPTVQLDHAYRELTGGDAEASAHWNEIKNAKTRDEAKALFKHYFERPGAVGGDKMASGYGKDPAISAGNWNVSPQAIAFEQGRSNTTVRYMSPDDYLAMTPEMGEGGSPARRSLARSLALGEDIQAIPTLDVKADGGKLKVYDQDGRNRAVAAKEAGVDLIPVAIHGVGADADIKEIEGMRGDARPFDFKPVAKTEPRATASESFWSGVRTPIEGAAQLLAHALPATVTRGINNLNNTLSDAGVPLGKVPEGGIDEYERQRQHELERSGAAGSLPYAAGEIASTIPLAALGGGASLAARSGIGAVAGGLAGAAAPVDDPAHYWTEKAEQIGLGVVGGALTVPIAEGIVAGLGRIATPIARWLGAIKGPEAVESPAAKAVLQRIDKDIRGGGPTAQDMLDIVASAPGKPLTLMDIGGENLRGLAGRVARAPGPARQQLMKFLDDRDRAAGERIAGDVKGAISRGGTAYQTREALMRARSAAARPLYEKAFAGGSMAPLERHFEIAFNDADAAENAASQRVVQVRQAVTQALAKQTTARNVYSTSAANRARQFAQDKITEAERALEAARLNKANILGRLRRAQADGSSNAPGAVWSPRLQQFLDNPTVQQGIRRGWKLQRLEDLADGRPFNPSEFAVVGTEKNGDPIVGNVPNMRLLDAGKKGLDAIVTRHTDPVTGRMDETGKVVNDVRTAYRTELDRLNQDYKAARDAWSGPSQSIDAINAGRRILATNPEKIAADLAQMSPSDREFYKLGAADILIERLAKKGPSADEAKLIIGNDWTKSQLRPLFNNQADYDRFISAIEAESTMFKTGYDVLGNSRTAARLAEDFTPMTEAAARAGHAALGAAHGNYLHAGINALRGLSAFGRRVNQPLNSAIADILTAPLNGQSTGMNLLRNFATAMPATRNYLLHGMVNPVGRIAAPIAGMGIAGNNMGQGQ